MLLPLQNIEGKSSWILHSVLSTKLFEELLYLHSSLKKRPKHKTGRRRSDTGHLEPVKNMWVWQHQPETPREPRKGIGWFSPTQESSVRPENYWRELVYQSHSKWKGVSFTKDGVLSDSFDISIESGKRDQAVRNCEQTGHQYFSDSFWAAWEHDRWRLNQWQGQLLLSMGEDTTSVVSY